MASISAQTGAGSNGLVLSSGSIQSLSNNTLTLGGTTTGNISLMPGNGSGNVGIGTTVPGSILDVAGSIERLGTNVYPTSAYSGSNNTYLVLDKGGTGSDDSIVMRDQGNARAEIGIVGDDSIHFKTVSGSYPSETFTDRFIIDTSGNVYTANAGKFGVGTVPTDQFDVAGNYTGSRLIAKIENTSVGSSHSSALELKGDSSNDWVFGTDFGENGNNNLFIQDAMNNALRVFIDNNGQVAIGGANSSPLATLDVRGNVATTPVTLYYQARQLFLPIQSSTNQAQGDLFTASKSGATKFTILNNGNLSLANYQSCGSLTTNSREGY